MTNEQPLPKINRQGNRKRKCVTPKPRKVKTTWEQLEAREAAQAQAMEGSPSKLQVREMLCIQLMLMQGFSQEQAIKQLNKLRVRNNSHPGVVFDTATWENWKRSYPQFFIYVDSKDPLNDVAKAYIKLQDMIEGEEVWEERAVTVMDGVGTSHVEIVKVKKKMPSSFPATKFLLVNLDSDRFADKKTLELPDLTNLTDDEVRDALKDTFKDK